LFLHRDVKLFQEANAYNLKVPPSFAGYSHAFVRHLWVIIKQRDLFQCNENFARQKQVIPAFQVLNRFWMLPSPY